MTVRQSSIKTYHDLKSEGVVGLQEFEILQFLSAVDAPQTLKEISRSTGLEINVVSGRVNSLKKKDLNHNTILVECDKRVCTISGRWVTPVKVNPQLFSNSFFNPQHVTQAGIFNNHG